MAAQAQSREQISLIRDTEIEAILRAYAELIYPEGENQPLGSFDPARIKAVQDFYVDAGLVRTAVPVDELYTNEFIK